MDTADIALMVADLNKVNYTLSLSHHTLTVIQQNLFWAFLYNAIAIPLASFGYLNPSIAAAAMALSSLSVVINSLQLYKKKF